MNKALDFLKKNENAFGDGMLDNPILITLVEKFVFSGMDTFELSRKVKNLDDFFCRVHLRFASQDSEQPDYLLQTGLKLIKFTNNLNMIPGVRINVSELFELFSGIPADAFSAIATGVDLRKNWQESRFKIWLELHNNPQIINMILEKYSSNKDINRMSLGKEITLSFNFHYDNTCWVKLYYPIFNFKFDKEKQEHYKKFFTKKIIDGFYFSDFCYISFPTNTNRFIYFGYNKGIPDILKVLGINVTEHSGITFQGQFPYGIGCFEDYILNPETGQKEFNYYYNFSHIIRMN